MSFSDYNAKNPLDHTSPIYMGRLERWLKSACNFRLLLLVTTHFEVNTAILFTSAHIRSHQIKKLANTNIPETLFCENIIHL